MKALVSRAHCSPTVVKDFSTVSLPPLLSSLLGFQDATPALQAVVLPCLSTIHLLYPSACKPHRVSVFLDLLELARVMFVCVRVCVCVCVCSLHCSTGPSEAYCRLTSHCPERVLVYWL